MSFGNRLRNNAHVVALFFGFLSLPQPSHAVGSIELCEGDWSEYVGLVAQWKNTYLKLQEHQFLFIGPDFEIRNCLDETFSDDYISGLKRSAFQTGLFGLYRLNGAIIDICGLTHVTSDPPTFTLVRLPYDRAKLKNKECRTQLVAVMPYLWGLN